MTPIEAETLGLEALLWLLERQSELDHFLSATGMAADHLRRDARDPLVLAAVLDHVLSQEELARGFCESQGRTGRDLHLARHELAGP